MILNGDFQPVFCIMLSPPPSLRPSLTNTHRHTHTNKHAHANATYADNRRSLLCQFPREKPYRLGMSGEYIDADHDISATYSTAQEPLSGKSGPKSKTRLRVCRTEDPVAEPRPSAVPLEPTPDTHVTQGHYLSQFGCASLWCATVLPLQGLQREFVV